MKKLWLWVLNICFVGAACERTIDFKLDQSEPKLVVEATIENNQPPVVIVSQSQNYFYTNFAKLFACSFFDNSEV
jgi:hypothetical protein